MNFQPVESFAHDQDHKDPLAGFRDLFHIPKSANRDLIYFTGNSLGLQPKTTRQFLETELLAWEELAVEGHFHGKNPWFYYHKFSKQNLARLTGSLEHEVVAMNGLTPNLHLMMASFYQPTTDRYKILIEAGAFPSDQYAVESQARFHGFDPEQAIVEVPPSHNKHYIDTEDIMSLIHEHGESLALILFPGVQYYSGQYFELNAICKAGHAAGAFVGFDLAHAIGNVPLHLHNDGPDFAVWCSYKYLNSGPGGVAGAFVHERHANSELPRFSGWWGHNEQERFKMKKGFIPIPGVDGWQLSNINILSAAALQASLEIFDQAGIENLRQKSILLTGYLEYLLNLIPGDEFDIITPTDPDQRGCQLSLLFRDKGRLVFDYLTENGIVTDWREPDVIRISPVPLYNKFHEVFLLYQNLNSVLNG